MKTQAISIAIGIAIRGLFIIAVLTVGVIHRRPSIIGVTTDSKTDRDINIPHNPRVLEQLIS